MKKSSAKPKPDSHWAMNKVFGCDYNQRILSCTFISDTECVLNHDTYMGHSVNDLNEFDDPKTHALDVKRKLESLPEFQDLEVVSFAVMPVHYYPGWRNILDEAFYRKISKNIAGTIVFRNKKTGRVVRDKAIWQGVKQYKKVRHAAQRGLGFFIRSAGIYYFSEKRIKAMGR